MPHDETVARATVKCLRRPKPEIWPAWSVFVRYGMAAAMAFPRSGDWGLDRLVRGWEKREAAKQSQATERRSDGATKGTRAIGN